MKHKPTEFVLSFKRRLYRELLQSILVLFPSTYMQHIQFSCVSGQLIALKSIPDKSKGISLEDVL